MNVKSSLLITTITTGALLLAGCMTGRSADSTTASGTTSSIDRKWQYIPPVTADWEILGTPAPEARVWYYTSFELPPDEQYRTLKEGGYRNRGFERTITGAVPDELKGWMEPAFDIDYQKNQVLELIERYNPTVLWFDGDWAGWWTMDEGITLYNAIRDASPTIIVNNRVAKRNRFKLDYVTQEQKHFKDAFAMHWEGCYTMNNSWGYKKNDNRWKSPQTVYDKLKDINTKGGNLLLNVGPDGNGEVQQEAYDILLKTAELIKANPITKNTPEINKVPHQEDTNTDGTTETK